MSQIYLKLLADCTLKNGILTVPNLHDFEYVQLASELRTAIINYEVPHWKIIGINVALPDVSQLVDFVTKPKGVSKSYAELIPVMKKVIAAEGGGVPSAVRDLTLDAGCFYKKPGDIAFISDTEGIVNTYDGHLTYECYPNHPVKFLSKTDIIETESSIVTAIMYRGTGLVDFSETQAIIAQSYRNNLHIVASGQPKRVYCPMSVVYDLSQFVTVKFAGEHDQSVKLLYKSAIDETVLESILKQFGRELQEV